MEPRAKSFLKAFFAMGIAVAQPNGHCSLAGKHAPESSRVNAVLPRLVETPLLRTAAHQATPDHPQAGLDACGKSHLIGRVIAAGEVD